MRAVLVLLLATQCLHVSEGAWTDWGSWSDCHVSCGNGTMSRMRVCSNPSPSADDGAGCAGTGLEHGDCSTSPCPDRTDWGPWSPWSRCSLTCDMGVQKRRRTCRHLGRHGETCSGDDDDSKACFIRACSDGSWSTWSPWQRCSATCDSGLQLRNRSCDNPAPSRFGRACAGNDRDMRTCNAKPCSASQYGSQMAPPVVYSVHSPTGQLIGRHDGNGQIALFSKASINMGGAYNMATGIFTCPVNGVYRFSVALRSTHDTFCNIIQNHDVTLTYAQVSINAEKDTGYNEVFVRLSAGDIVSLECDVRWYNVDKGQGTSFNGQLIYAGV